MLKVKKDYPKISIIFPNLNGDPKDLRALLSSIEKGSYPQNKLEVVIVDNGSTESNLVALKNFKFQISNFKLIENKKNLGFAKAVNIGVERSTGDYLFITNNDCVLEKYCLENLVKFLINNPEVGIVGPKTYKKDGKSLFHPAPRYNFYLGLFHDTRQIHKIQESDWVPASGLLISRASWERLGGFDRDLFFTYEDLDLCLRAKKLGFKVMYYPEAVIWHNHGATINRPEFTYFKYYHGYRGKIRTILKHANLVQIITSLFLQLFVFAPFRFLILRENSLVALTNAVIWNIKNLANTLSSRRRHEATYS